MTGEKRPGCKPMIIQTHNSIDKELCGKPLEAGEGYSRVELLTTNRMAVDETGLVHGGFIFGLADHAAMIAVNHPNVVLGASDVRFLKPVKACALVMAEARVKKKEGNKQIVSVTVEDDGVTVFKGEFTCFIPDQHVLTAGK
jgi:uncharacterized protein (TIGR00369 family)